MAAPTHGPYGTPILDNFNRADGDPGANWINPYDAAYGKPSISGNHVTAPGGAKSMRWVNAMAVANTEVWGTFAAGAGQLYARSTALLGLTGTTYQLVIVTMGLQLNTYTSGTPSVIASAWLPLSYPPVALSCIGSAIGGWYWDGSGWQLACSVVNGTYASAGYLGVTLSGTLDDFGGGAIALPNPVCCTFTPPVIGTLGLIVTIDATAEANDVGGLSITTHNGGGSTPCTGNAVQEVDVARVPAGHKLVIDGAKHTVTLIDALGVESDGVEYLDLGDAGLDWLEVSQNCNYATCVCVQTAAPCTGGASTTVKIDTQYRRL